VLPIRTSAARGPDRGFHDDLVGFLVSPTAATIVCAGEPTAVLGFRSSLFRPSDALACFREEFGRYGALFVEPFVGQRWAPVALGLGVGSNGSIGCGTVRSWRPGTVSSAYSSAARAWDDPCRVRIDLDIFASLWREPR